VLDVYDQPPFASGIVLNLDQIRDSATRLVADYDVRTTSVLTPAGTLSGGNQQKVIVARELSRDNKMLLASQPTRGLDVGSIEFVHSQIVAQRDRGVAVVIVSSELDEIYALSDRIAVMYEGQIVGFCEPDIPEAQLGLMMAGVAAGAATAGAAGGNPAAHLPGPDEKLELPGALSPDPEATSGPAEQP
jgi:simple sugar transport system ATP-binding protein